MKYTDPDGRQINKSDVRNALQNPKSALYGLCNSSKAEKWAEKNEERLRRGLHNGPADAARHALWSAMNARDVGTEDAKKIGDAHEQNPEQADEERARDLHNNSVGYQIGASHPDACDEELQGLVIEALNNGMLQEGLDNNKREPLMPQYDGSNQDDDYKKINTPMVAHIASIKINSRKKMMKSQIEIGAI